MDVSRIRALRGPNLWSRNTAIEAIVRCSEEESQIGQLPGFEARLRMLFPAIGEHWPIDSPPQSLAQVLEVAALALQAQAGCPVTYSRSTATVEPGTHQVVVEYSEEEVGRQALTLAQELIRAAADGGTFDAVAAVSRLRDIDEDLRLGPSTGSIVNAAVARGIPYRRLTQGSLVQFGWGSKQRRIQAAEVDTTSAVAESIAQDKDLTKTLLLAAGVPVPIGRPVSDADDAWAAAQQIGLPVVVKPQDGNQGKGVTVNVVTREQLDAAFKAADEIGSVMVEKYLPGADYRLLVVGKKLVAAARRDPPLVIGDGRSTVQALVERVNAAHPELQMHAIDDIWLETLRTIVEHAGTLNAGMPRYATVALSSDSVKNTAGIQDVLAEFETLDVEGAYLLFEHPNGDYIVQGVKGEIYPCKPDIFELTYNPA